MSIFFSPKSLNALSTHLRSASLNYKEIAHKVRTEALPGWERLADQFDKQQAEADQLIEQIDEELDCIQLGVKA